MAPLRRLTAGRTTFLITHDRRLTALADLVLHLTEGTVTVSTPGAAGPAEATGPTVVAGAEAA